MVSVDKNPVRPSDICTRTGERRVAENAPLPVEEKRTGSDRRSAEGKGAAKVMGGMRDGDLRMGIQRGIIWFAILALTAAAVPVYKGGVYKPGAGFGYAIGIIGAVMMLLMLLYPLRKHARWMHSWGPLRYWFMLHMIFGIGGPVLVLFHSTFHVKSSNAAISLYSMLLVAISGVIGRFIYRRIHNGLYGRKSTLEGLQKDVSCNQQQLSAILQEAPAIADKMKQFYDTATNWSTSQSARLWKFMTLSLQRRKLVKRCSEELRHAVDSMAEVKGWDRYEREQHWGEASDKVRCYLEAVQQAAQYSQYERLFRWWHILHTPFVWMLGISAIVHVVAVNMY
jgi:hypothetical protein